MGGNLGLPQVIQSDSVPFVPAGTPTIKKDFLEPALSMDAPVIRRMWVRAQLNVTVPGQEIPGVVEGGMLTHFLAKFLMKDRSGERINVNGGELRVIAQHDLGWGYLDQPPIPTGTAALNVEFYIPIILVQGDKAASTDDTALVLPDFYSGGEITLNFVNGAIGPGNPGTGSLTINSGTISIVAEVVDEGTPEAKSRLSWLSQSLLNSDSSYPMNGKLRAALLYVGEVNEEAGTKWGSAGQTIESRSFNYLALPQPSFAERYTEEGYNDPTTDTIINNFVIPMYVTHRGNKIVRMPVFNNLHVKFSQALPLNATLVTGVFTQRSEESIALAFRSASPAQLASLIQQGGVVPGNSGAVPAMALPASQRRYLPIRIGTTPSQAPPVTPVGQAVR